MLPRTTIIRITTKQSSVTLSPEQAMLRAHELAKVVSSAKAALLKERVRLGCFLIQVQTQLGRGGYGLWLGAGGVHQKTAQRCQRLAAAIGDKYGDMDRRQLFDALHAMDARAFPSLEQFDEHRVSLNRVEIALGIRERSGDAAHQTEWDNGPSRSAPGSGDERMARMGLEVGGLPRARVGDIAGQGVLHGLFAPFARRLEEFAGSYSSFDSGKQRRAEQIIARCDRELRELMGADARTTEPGTRPPTRNPIPDLRACASSSPDAAGHNNDGV